MDLEFFFFGWVSLFWLLYGNSWLGFSEFCQCYHFLQLELSLEHRGGPWQGCAPWLSLCGVCVTNQKNGATNNYEVCMQDLALIFLEM